MKLKAYFFSTIISFAAAAAAVFIIAALQFFEIIQEKNASLSAFFAVVLVSGAGAMLCAKINGTKKLLSALLVSVTYIIVLLALSALLHHALSLHFMMYVLMGSITGAGILGAIFAR